MTVQLTAPAALQRGLAPREWIELEARRRGFLEVGVTDLQPFAVAGKRAQSAIEEGRMAGMPWFTEERLRQASDLGRRYPWARSLVALTYPRPRIGAAPVAPGRDDPSPRLRGRIASYALGEDYHALLDRRLRELAGALKGRFPDLRWHRFVDHGWALDRAIAERSGVGFCGKHTQLISRSGGSYVLLASLLTNLDLSPDLPSRKSCGHCQVCLEACPTGALLGPGRIDAPRCISYLTIEHQGAIDPALRPLLGTWVFGCDLCQEPCPINKHLQLPEVAPGEASTASGPVPFPDLLELLEVSEAQFRERFRGTTLLRSGRERLARNAAIALGNLGHPAAIPALARALGSDPSPTVRGACAWSLGRLGGRPARSSLRERLPLEQDPEAKAELEAALRAIIPN